jgi:hypothetical protein
MTQHTHCPKCGSDSFDTPQWSSRSGTPPFEDYHVCCSCDHEWLDSDEPGGFDDQMIVSILRKWCETDNASKFDSEWHKGYQSACKFVKSIVGEAK